jgi:hypothetical protein
MIDISQAFGTPAEPIGEFYQRPGVGYYIPLYQRDYSWSQENIDQLMEDIIYGVENLLNDDDVIHFMGTVILIKENNPQANIEPRDHRALPSTINNVIDGQQRISTISLLACLLYQKIAIIASRLPGSNPDYAELIHETKSILSTLKEIFSVDLTRGEPSRKPVIIRGSVDCWTFDGQDGDNYTSDVSNYLASLIREIEKAGSENRKLKLITTPSCTLVGKNLKRMNSILTKVEKCHLPSSGFEYPTAWDILSNMPQEHIWSYAREDLVELINNRPDPISRNISSLCSLVQLFTFAHFMLKRCCFTLITPIKEDWAFDMFQSLNATGTPLTAVETFKALVVNMANNEGGYKHSEIEKHYNNIDALLGASTSASQKNKLTNEFLITFALNEESKKLQKQFSAQRSWLTNKYTTLPSLAERSLFVQRMSELAVYWKDVIEYDPNKFTYIRNLTGVDEHSKKLACLCILYLRDAGHKMSNTILSMFYAHVLRGEENAEDNFIEACKVIASFFTIWRSALPNTGLDEVYRVVLKGDEVKGIPRMCWDSSTSHLTIEKLKSYLVNVLERKNIATKEEWLTRASRQLRYDSAKFVCKFSLFLTAHDTQVDEDSPGLMKVGTPGSSLEYLDPMKWISKDFKTIEHVAPVKKPTAHEWDEQLYVDDGCHKIGNLTLLPIEINSSAGNRNWRQKLVYYQHLAETDPTRLESLSDDASSWGVDLSEETIQLLCATDHKHHIRPIVEVGSAGSWDSNLVDSRGKRICEIVWDKMHEWLFQ